MCVVVASGGGDVATGDGTATYIGVDVVDTGVTAVVDALEATVVVASVPHAKCVDCSS